MKVKKNRLISLGGIMTAVALLVGCIAFMQRATASANASGFFGPNDGVTFYDNFVDRAMLYENRLELGLMGSFPESSGNAHLFVYRYDDAFGRNGKSLLSFDLLLPQKDRLLVGGAPIQVGDYIQADGGNSNAYLGYFSVNIDLLNDNGGIYIVFYAMYTDTPSSGMGYWNEWHIATTRICLNWTEQGAFVINDMPTSVVDLPEKPIKEGYDFTGWYLDADCTMPYYGDPITGDTQLHAGWAKKTHSVTYRNIGVNGNSNTTVTMDWGSVIDYVPDARVGYDFMGWYTDSACTTPYDDTPVTSNVTLYAMWQLSTYTITYNVNGGDMISSAEATYGTKLGNYLPTPTHPNVAYKFGGWYSDSEFANAANVNMTIVASKTVYAKWELKTYIVTFVVDGETYATIEVTHGTSFVAAAQAVGLSSVDYTLADNPLFFDVLNGSDGAATSNITLYATDKANGWLTSVAPYIDQFIANDGIAILLSVGLVVGIIVMLVLRCRIKVRGGRV